MVEGTIKFILDEQLGKLARWLRIIGQDAEYQRQVSDDELLARARSQGRVVLTRDRSLAERAAGVTVICLAANYPAWQLREVVERFKERIKIRVFSRCVACNGEVEAVDKDEVRDQVPAFVFATQEQFTRCRRCGKIYGKATHRDRVEVQLKEVLGELYIREEV